MKNAILLSIIAVLLTLSIFKCGSESVSGPAGVFTETHNITNIDTVAHTITVQRIEYHCEDSLVVADTMDLVYYYALRDTLLYIWKPLECGAGLFTGKSGSLYGTWVATDLNPVLIPADVRPAGCGTSLRSTIFGNIVPDQGPVAREDSFLINETVTLTITPNSVSTVYDGDFCFARVMGDLYSIILATPVTRNCEYVVLQSTIDTARKATVTSSVANQQTTLTFQYDSVSCYAVSYIDLATQVPDCPDTATAGPMEAYNACVEESGFFRLQ